ncbi:MAG: filamentous hemagglutinin, partial [Selenomonas sp.]|nr:filamentous hemagglutinin [Selenomonas sp.]
MRKAFNEEFGTFSAGNYSVEKNVYGKGTINRRNIDPNNFDVVDDHNVTSHATKEYDGTTTYNVPTGWKLNPSSGPTTGVIAGDDVTFHLTSDGAQFTTAAHNPTPNAYDADKVMYNVAASGDREKIKNYTLGGRKLEDGKAKVYGEGKITRRVLSLALVNNTDINKVYDGQTGLVDTDTKHWAALTKTDAKGNVEYTAGSKELVNDGSSFHIEANYRNSANTANDKNVAYDSATPRNIIDKAIEYNIHITGGDARNYAFANGTPTPTNAESGLKLSATGKITPKDLSGAFKKVTKVYDGTKNVPAAQVGFEIGANGVVAGDAVDLASGHTQEFESENVRGSDTPWTAPDGTRQHNWVNYSNLSLTGADAGNYTLSLGATAKGLGEITPFELNPNTVNLAIGTATKTYDGTKTVKWTDGSSALSDQKKYITSATVNINGNPVNVLNDLKLTSAEYDTKDVDNGRFANRVTYNLSYTGTSGNFSLGGASTFAKQGDGVITKKDVTVTLKTPFTKVYDATTDVIVKRANNQLEKATANDLVTLTGLVAGDGATNVTTARYGGVTPASDDKNAGTNKDVTYNVKIDSSHAGNYNLKYNGSVITAPITKAGNTITKRSVEIKFNDPPPRMYNTTAKNTYIKPFVSADDAAVLKTDANTLVSGTDLDGLTGIDSNYVKNDKTTPDPNVGTNKYVRFENIRTAMGTALGADAANYEFNDTAYGKGTITKARVDALTDFDFRTSAFAEKEYDGNRDIKWQGDTGKIENYFVTAPGTQGSRVKIDGVWRDITSSDIKVDAAHSKYHNKNVGTYTTDSSTGKQYNAQVDYRIKISTQNFDVDHLSDGFIPFDNQPAIITPRDITPYFNKSHIIKEYDGTENLSTANINAINETKRLSILVPGDDVTLNVAGVYMNTARSQNEKDASADTEAIAEARTDANAGRSVKYSLSLDGADKGNYGFKNAHGGYDMNTDVYGTGDIYKKTLTVKVGAQEKYYDDTRKVGRNVGGSAVFIEHPDAATIDLSEGVVGTEHVAFDQTAADKINGLYSDSNAGNAKDISYTGFENALADYVARNSNSDARNYRVDDKASGKGSIKARPINASDIVNVLQFKEASKVYDGTEAIKYKGSSASADLINYLDSAKININGKEVDLKTDLRIDDNKANTHYADKDAHGEATQNNLTYHLNYVGNNFEVRGSIDKTDATGKILRKEITATVNGPLTKEYDATRAVYDAADSSIKTFHKSDLGHQNQVDRPDDLVTIRGLVAGDGATNATTATFDDKNVGTNKNVTYDVKIDPANADNYHISIATITKRGNEITPRRLTMKFRNVDKIYDGTAENDDVRAYTDTADDRKVLERDHITFNADDNVDGLTDVDSRYGDVTNGAFTDNPNAGAHKVRYQNISSAMNALLGNAGANYKIADEVLGDGTINKATVGRNSFDFVFDRADKEYDGTAVVYGKNHSTDLFTNLNTDETQPTHSKVTWQDKNGHTLTRTLRNNDVKAITGEYRDGKNALVHVSTDPNNPNPVDYHLVMNADNFTFNDTGMYDVLRAEGQITKRKLIADPTNYLTKEYDGKADIIDKARNAQGTLITGRGDKLVKFHHYGGTPTHPDDGEDTVFYREVNAGTVSNNTTAAYVAVDATKYADKDVEWKDNVWNQGRGVVGDKNVKYKVALTGDDAA